MKRLMILAALAMVTLSMTGCHRNRCGGGLFGHRWDRDRDGYDDRMNCRAPSQCEMPEMSCNTGCDPCSGGGGFGAEVIGPPPAMIGR